MMRMFYTDEDGTTVEYALKTDPPEAAFWQTYKIKKSNIKIITKMSREDQAVYRQKILDDFLD